MLLHPIHDGWYGDNFESINYCRKSLIDTIKIFDKNQIYHDNILVYPGSSPNNADLRKALYPYINCGVNSGSTKLNNGIVDKFNLNRLFINFQTHNKTYYKEFIDNAVNNNSWLILGAHSWQFTDSDIVDENTNSTANLKDLLRYANNKCQIKLVNEVINKRKYLLDLYSNDN